MDFPPSNSQNLAGLSRAKMYLSSFWSAISLCRKCTVSVNFSLFCYICNIRIHCESAFWY